MYLYMYVCMYVCVVCMYVCMYVWYVCMYVCTHACMYVCMYACMYVCMYVVWILCVDKDIWGLWSWVQTRAMWQTHTTRSIRRKTWKMDRNEEEEGRRRRRRRREEEEEERGEEKKIPNAWFSKATPLSHTFQLLSPSLSIPRSCSVLRFATYLWLIFFFFFFIIIIIVEEDIGNLKS